MSPPSLFDAQTRRASAILDACKKEPSVAYRLAEMRWSWARWRKRNMPQARRLADLGWTPHDAARLIADALDEGASQPHLDAALKWRAANKIAPAAPKPPERRYRNLADAGQD